MSDEELIAYYQGCYDQCRRLLTSPRLNRPQREIIEGEAYFLKAELEDRGVTPALSEAARKAEREGGQG